MRLILFGLAFISFFAYAQEYPLTYYSLKDGLANSSVTSIFQDKKGNLWFTTFGGGVSMYNGSSFKNIGTEHGLTSLLTRTVSEDSKGRILIGTSGEGLCLFEKDTAVSFKRDSLPTEIFAIHTAANGIIWLGTNGGVFTINLNDEVENFTEKHQLLTGPVTHINSDAEGAVWFAYDEFVGLYCYKNGELILYNEENGLTNGRINSSFHDAAQNTWVGAHDGLYKIPHGSNRAFKITAEGIPDYYLFDFAEPKKGILVIGSQANGLLFYDSEKNEVIKTIGTKNGLRGTLCFRVFSDYENNIWISNWGEGVARFNFSGFTKYGENAGLESKLVSHILKVDDQLVLSTSNGLYTLNNSTLSPLSPGKINGSIACSKVVNGTFFCARERDFLVLKNNTLKIYTDLCAQSVKGILTDKNGTIYTASWNGGIAYFKDDKFHQVRDTVIDEIGYYYTAFADSKGTLWFGSWDAGLVYYDGKKWARLTTENGLPSNKITTITEDKNGKLIVGTNGGGIAVQSDLGFKIINTSNGLRSNSVYAVAIDDKNNIWAGFQGTVSYINGEDFQVINYSTESGFDGDCMYSSLLCDGNSTWIGTNNFLWKFNPEDIIPRKKNLRIYINQVLCNNNEISDSSIQLRHNQNKITFRFGNTQIYNNAQVRYSYRLTGIDTLFSPLTSQDEITFHELAPGTYKFEVKACLNDECSDEPAVYSFVILPPIWKTWWFITLSVILSVFILWLYVRYREYKLLRRQRELEETVEERTVEIREQKKIVEEKNKEIIDSISYAKRLQDAILPPVKLVKEYLAESFILYKPKDIVAGDFYWMASFASPSKSFCGEGAEASDADGSNLVESGLSKKDQTVLFAAADCTGHGVPGAMVSVVCNHALNRSVREYKITDPGKILDKTRELVIQEFEKSDEEVKDGMDISLCSLSLSTLTLKWAGANNPLWIIRKGTFEVEEIKPNKQPIGKFADQKPFVTHTVQLQRGDSIYIFTDGFQDQFGGEKGKKFKASKLKELLVSVQRKTMDEQKNILNETFESWRGNLEQIDDICMIGVRV